MGYSELLYELDGIVELDEGYFSTEVPEEQKDKPLKRGRGSQRKTKVLVMAETGVPSVEEAVKARKRGQCKPTKVGRIKMIVIVKADTIDPIASQSITTESTIVTDDSSSYTNFHKMFKEHHSQVIPLTSPIDRPH